MQRAEHPVAVRIELAAVRLDDPRECLLVVAPSRLDQLLGLALSGL